MSETKEKISKENKEKQISKSTKIEDKPSFKNLKKIRKDLMSFAKDEILNIKKSKKDISVASFEPQEHIAPSKYSMTTKKLQPQSQKKNYNSNFEPVEEKNKIKKDNKDKKVEISKNAKDEVSSSDISDDDDE